MKIAYVGNTQRSYAEDGSVVMPSATKRALAKITERNIFSDDVITFSGKEFDENGYASFDYYEVIKAVKAIDEDEEVFIVGETYNWHPDDPMNTPGTYYNAMGNYNTSKQDYEAARPWATTAQFIDTGEVKNNTWNQLEKLASDFIGDENVRVYIHMSGENGLFDATASVESKGKVNPDHKLTGLPILEVISKFSKGIEGEIANTYAEFGVLALALDNGVFRCNGCGNYIRKHTESLVKPWEGEECTVVDPYEDTVISICPECGKELTQADIDYGLEFVEKLVEKQLADKRRKLEREAHKGIIVRKGDIVCKHITPMPDFIIDKDDEVKVEGFNVTTLDPSTLQKEYKYTPCTFKPEPKKAWKVPKLKTTVFIDWKPPVKERQSFKELCEEYHRAVERFNNALHNKKHAIK